MTRRGPVKRTAVAPAVLALRTATLGVTCALAGLLLLAGHPRVALLAAGAAAVAGLLAVALPAGIAPTATLLLLIGEDVAATDGRSVAVRVLVAVPVGAGLWALHALYGLAAAVPLDAQLHRTVLLRWAHRLGEVLAVAVPGALVAAALVGRVGAHGWLPWVAAGAAAVLVTGPALLLRRGG